MTQAPVSILSLLESHGIPTHRGRQLMASGKNFTALSVADIEKGLSDWLAPLGLVTMMQSPHEGSMGGYRTLRNAMIPVYFGGFSLYGYMVPVPCGMDEFIHKPVKMAMRAKSQFVEMHQDQYRQHLLANCPDCVPNDSGDDLLREFTKTSFVARYSKWGYEDWLAIHRVLAVRLQCDHAAFGPVVKDIKSPVAWLELARWIRLACVSYDNFHCVETALAVDLINRMALSDKGDAFRGHLEWIGGVEDSMLDDADLTYFLHYKRRIFHHVESSSRA